MGIALASCAIAAPFSEVGAGGNGERSSRSSQSSFLSSSSFVFLVLMFNFRETKTNEGKVQKR